MIDHYIRQSKTRSIIATYDDPIWDRDCNYMELNEWNNGEGFSLSTDRGDNISLSIEEALILKKLINRFIYHE